MSVVDINSGQPAGKPSGGNGGDGGNHGERLAAIEAHLQHMATKAWVLGGVVGGMVSACIIALTFIKVFG